MPVAASATSSACGPTVESAGRGGASLPWIFDDVGDLRRICRIVTEFLAARRRGLRRAGGWRVLHPIAWLTTCTQEEFWELGSRCQPGTLSLIVEPLAQELGADRSPGNPEALRCVTGWIG